MGKYNIYAVAYGVNPMVNTTQPMIMDMKFKTWDECKQCVSGVQGAKYKGFLTESEADAWLEKTINELHEKYDSVGCSNPDASNWQDKAKKIYDTHIHPVDEEFIATCKDLGLSIHDTEHLMKMMFVNIVKYLDDNDCINKLPFEEE